MKKVNILHLYSKSLDLYGDYKNLAALCQRIEETGNTVTVTAKEHFEPVDFTAYDMVYIGHGKAKNLAAVANHFAANGDAVKEQIEKGQVWFVTGNARQLFGKSFTTVTGSEIAGIGLFDYTAEETNKVYVSDMVGTPLFDETKKVYGFTNRTAHLMGENPYPLFRVNAGFGDGATPGATEGTLYKNFFATWAMGPALIRNPILMQELLKRLLGEDYRECDYSLEQKALDLVLKEFDLNKGETV